MKTLLILSVIAGLSIAAYCYNPATKEERELALWLNKMKDERAELMLDMLQIRHDIHVELDRIGKDVDPANKVTWQDLTDLKSSLESQREKVQRSVRDVRNSSDEKWTSIKGQAEQILTDARTEFARVQGKIESRLAATF